MIPNPPTTTVDNPDPGTQYRVWRDPDGAAHQTTETVAIPDGAPTDEELELLLTAADSGRPDAVETAGAVIEERINPFDPDGPEHPESLRWLMPLLADGIRMELARRRGPANAADLFGPGAQTDGVAG